VGFTVKLNAKVKLGRAEVDDEGADGMLASEADAP
jgi:hypothetical protein